MFNNTWEFFVSERDLTSIIKLISKVISTSTKCYTTYCEWATEDKRWIVGITTTKRQMKRLYMELLELGLEDDTYKPYVKQIKEMMEDVAL